MAKGGRYMWRARGKAPGACRVPVDAYSGASFAKKREYQMQRVGRRPEPLYQCRLCIVRVLGRDREGHLRRNHSQAADVLVCFKVVKK